MFQRSYRKTRSLNLTSLIDVMFFLLIFFMLTSSFYHDEAITLEFNDASVSHDLGKEAVILVTARHDNKLGLDNAIYSPNRFRYQLQELMTSKEGDYVIALKADNDATIQDLTEAIDYVHLSGATNITVVANPAAPRPQESI